MGVGVDNMMPSTGLVSTVLLIVSRRYTGNYMVDPPIEFGQSGRACYNSTKITWSY